MKTNAIVRIVIYSVVILLLIGLLLMGLGIGTFVFSFGSGTGEVVNGGEGSVAADSVSKLKIDWASGSVIIQTADTDQITFSESGSFSEDQAMAYSVRNGTLKLSYSKASVQIGFVSLPSKDLVITVPKDWVCKELELDGAALEMEINDLTVELLDIDGASNEITFNGNLTNLECDGASCEIQVVTTSWPSKIDLDGASCNLDLTLPADCGYRVDMDGLSCSFRSDFGGGNVYGNEHCYITADGLSCEINIHKEE